MFISLLSLLLLTAGPGYGQIYENEDDDFAPREKAIGFGLQMTNFGFGLDMHYWQKWRDKWEMSYNFELTSMKDPREVRIESAFADQGGNSYVFDKRHYGYAMGLTFGIHRVLLPLTSFSKLSFRGGLAVGPVFGIEIPYYIEYINPAPTPANPTLIEHFDYDRHARSFIVGQADYFEGWGEMNWVPGLRVNLYGTLNLASNALYVRALHMGLRGDFFTRPIELMDSQPDNAVFLGAYFGLMLGSAWN
ncbi:MAG: hypothetical protein ACOCZ8_01585 [Bacteroidota bacterium]